MENENKENIRLLKIFLIIVSMIAVFEAFQVYSLRKKLSSRGANVKTKETEFFRAEVERTRDYLKQLYDTYECQSDYKIEEPIPEQIYNLFICLNKKATSTSTATP